jgi:hypothetical protein
MRRLLLFVCLGSLIGCTADKGSFAEAAKDWRGDNMRMQSGQLNMTDSNPGKTDKLFD